MNKYSFQNDYSEGAHEKILKTLSDTNFTQSQGYGYDDYCQQAIYTMREKIQQPTADIHFVSGGT